MSRIDSIISEYNTFKKKYKCKTKKSEPPIFLKVNVRPPVKTDWITEWSSKFEDQILSNRFKTLSMSDPL